MAAGTPVVASDLPVVRELLSDRLHGRLVPPDRPVELARALRVLLEYPDEAAAMGAAAQSHVRDHLTWSHASARWEEVYGALGR
jgi:glycosyltransferase involved in cell wall biosynthesis